MSEHLLLTGATGLLGRYLLRDLTMADVKLALVVRPSRRQSATDRVDALLATWERQLGIELARPVVLEGDICQPDLGLDDWSQGWVADKGSQPTLEDIRDHLDEIRAEDGYIVPTGINDEMALLMQALS